MLFCLFLSLGASAQVTVPGNVTFTGPRSVANQNNVIFADQQAGADACAKITMALTLGNIVDARGFAGTPATCAAGLSIGSNQSVYLGNVTLTVTAQVLLTGSSSHLYGMPGATSIKQSGTFPPNTPVVQIGSSGSPVSPATVEGIEINCATGTNSIGGENAGGQEGSGFFNDIAANCTKYGFWYEGTPTQNSTGRGLIVETAGTAAVGVYIHNVPFRGISDVTVTSNDGNTPADCMVIDGSNGNYDGIHNDKCTVGIDIGPTAPVSIGRISTVTGGSNTPTNVKIENTPGNPPGGNRVILIGISCNGGTAARNVVDVLDGSPPSSCYEPLWAVGQAGQGQFRFFNAQLSAGATPAGATVNNVGLQLFNTTTTCTTAATINTPCTTAAITLPVAYADTNYGLQCQGLGPTNFPQLQTVTKSNTTFTITINNLTAAAASYSSFDCSVAHK